MIVTIDGPAGAGKSTVARLLAQRLGFSILDTGAMYRSVAWAAIERGVDLADAPAVLVVARSLTIRFTGERVIVDDRDVTTVIREPIISDGASAVADLPEVRSLLVEQQRHIASDGNYVCEGRDQGTVAFPNAEVKIFLSASVEARAQRRWQELVQHDSTVTLATVESQQVDRDRRDTERRVGALRRAADAVDVNTDGKSIEQVVDELQRIIRQKTGNASQS